MGFKYEEVKIVKLLIKEFQDEYWRLRPLYQELYQLDNRLPLKKLDEIILKLKEIATFKSSFVDFTELKSDIEFIEDYYKIKKWSSVNVWLSNTKSTLIESHKSYVELLSKHLKHKTKQTS